MSMWEEQARFLVTKYGTARGSAGFGAPEGASSVLTIPDIMVVLGLLLFGCIVFVLIRDVLERQRAVRQVRREIGE
jgi:hypothetical protein